MLANGQGAGHVFEFLKAYEKLTGRYGSPWSCLEYWELLVTDCEEGYHSNYDEFRYDCEYRVALDKILYAPEMEPFPEQIQAMRERVFAADDRLRKLFIPGVQIGGPSWEWWLRGVLPNGTPEYVEDMKQWGIDPDDLPDPYRDRFIPGE